MTKTLAKNLFTDITSKLEDRITTGLNTAAQKYEKIVPSFTGLSGQDENLLDMLSNFNKSSRMDVKLVISDSTEAGMYFPWATIRDSKDVRNILGAESASFEEYRDGAIVLNPNFQTIEILAHEYGHAIFNRNFVPAVDAKMKAKISTGLKLTSAAISLSSFIAKRHYIAAAAIAVASEVPTLFEEAYATRQGIYLMHEFEHKAKPGLLDAYLTYVRATLVSVAGGDYPVLLNRTKYVFNEMK